MVSRVVDAWLALGELTGCSEGSRSYKEAIELEVPLNELYIQIPLNPAFKIEGANVPTNSNYNVHSKVPSHELRSIKTG